MVGWITLCVGPTQNPLVFIEAKRLGNVDYRAEGQLFGYAVNRGVPFLILTDGNVWDFYLSMALVSRHSAGLSILTCSAMTKRLCSLL